ncbi:HD domain-containing phosphohydrolase [Halarcobacter ebronensis]|uniref:Phosphohydrolase n=1 Tax=Halarcobacter ebronensis TaxID=1462615 RepID=A0A4Q1ANY5_9BACT|nr:HD domain-containing phosphohydrolase [Halarcobacter ebronensis]QKF82377.1 c-di-GMP phosphodiesterase, class II (HD-GYP, GAF domains) [Halarcobacter ebronensis]RXK07597.1 phosphohydrolase [Halarcobacter ebronensis]
MNYLKVLGSSGSKTKFSGTTSFQVYKDIVIDAGNILNVLGNNALDINHIFLTHSHADHITDLPFIIDNFFEQRRTPLRIYASKQTISSLKNHTFNNEVWPDFSKIKLLDSEEYSLIFIEINVDEPIYLDPLKITPIEANHINGSFGFMIEKENSNGYIISGDTHKNAKIWEYINKNENITALLIECSFPSNLGKLAKDSKHLTAKYLAEDIEENLKRDDLQIFIYHLKSSHYEEIKQEIIDRKLFRNGGKILEDEDVIHFDLRVTESNMISKDKFDKILAINLELSSELDKDKLFEMILTLTKELTHCEGGTLYIVSKDKKYLDFKVVQNTPLNINMGGTKDNITWNSLPLYLEDGSENKQMVAVVSALEKRIINISDVYNETAYNFEGTKKFDKSTGYHSQTMLVIPLINHEQDVIGVLQLINKTKTINHVIPFTIDDEKIIKAFSSQAAMALTNSLLINSLEEFLNAFVETIAHAIDAKSTHTRNHIGKVAKIASYLAQAIDSDETIYKDVKYSSNEFRQIELAAWMHDIGKISMPESIIDKATKLQSMLDRIEIIKERFEVIKRDYEISYLKNEISKDEYKKRVQELEENEIFVEKVNIGGEFMRDEDLERIKEVSKLTYKRDKETIPLLNEDEVANLSIRKGTLTEEEKDIMNSHAQLTLDMLSALPFPKKYNRVLNIASNHHEKLNGKGYPRGLDEKVLTLEDKIMILADIFEALTASDRPYKEGKKLSEVFKILSFMVKDKEIDGELLKFFHEHEVLKKYSDEELKEFQKDKSEVTI